MKRTKPKSRKIKTIPWDSAEYLKTDQDIVYYLEAVFEDGDPALVAVALGDVARAKGMSQIAQTGRPWAREPLQGALAGGKSGIRDRAESGACARPQA
jgi:probable addiction module antidote protein